MIKSYDSTPYFFVFFIGISKTALLSFGAGRVLLQVWRGTEGQSILVFE